MAENVYERVNDYSSVKVTLASPNDIRAWSYGEVKKPETINYRTYRPEKDGLFCERIFGPERDYECACGKYRGTKYKGIICDRCGVKVTHSRVRRKRMGHINLASPIVHIWFFKSMPSRLGTLLGMKTSDLEKVIYYQDYVVIDPGDTEMTFKQVLTEDEHRLAVEKYGNAFRAVMGADSIRELIERTNLDEEAEKIRQDLRETRSKQKIKDFAKRLKLIEQIRNSENDPGWLVMDVVPVIPPDLRPLVLLESGNFATSDLNDLYRRIINRNNRLKKLMDLNAPDVIIRNEKRMLQQAVDALFDNGRCRRPVLGSSNRALKSLTDMIKGKQGRFRENLLGKRVDYSARSVIVVGPELKLWQCGLPKKIALELYQPFIIRKLKEHGLADTIKSAKRMLERRDPEVWDILEEVIDQHPVLLNRAPTLHRMGIQAFEPVLVEGNALRIHPLVCGGFNADFDGDQMAVHLPLSVEAQAEAHVLMLSTNNIFSPANGKPIISPSQDIVLGVYFATTGVPDERPAEQLRRFKDRHEALLAYEQGKIDIHERIVVRLDGFGSVVNSQSGPVEPMPENGRIITTAGRIVFADILAEGMPFYNCALGKKGCARVIDDCFKFCGKPATINLLDDMKALGFKQSTLAGLSFGVNDMRVPDSKPAMLAEAQKKVERVEKNYDRGIITERERYNQLLDIWSHCREQVTKKLIETLKNDRRDEDGNYTSIEKKEGNFFLNPVYLMSDSGARGNVSQMMQLAGMRGLMAKPSGEIIETPIRANFREGLSILEYFSSTHGARKGLADTALKTADSGYLTRKLCDIAQSVIIGEYDCGSKRGIIKRAIYKGEEIDVPLSEQIVGRVSVNSIVNPITDEVIVGQNEMITPEAAARVEELGIDSVMVRSPLTSESRSGCSMLDYGMDMSTGRFVEEGLAVGIIAAQSIGEPGTQLTMRTFHIGGTARGSVEQAEVRTQRGGEIRYKKLHSVKNNEGLEVVMNRNAEITVLDDQGVDRERFPVPYGATLRISDGQVVEPGTVIAAWDAFSIPIVAEVAGKVKYGDVVEGESMQERVDQITGKASKMITTVTSSKQMNPRISIKDERGRTMKLPEGDLAARYPLPVGSIITVNEHDLITAGTVIAKIPRETAKTKDITGGLPRVAELFEVRKPKEQAIITEIDGRVTFGKDLKGKRRVIVIPEVGEPKEYLIPKSKHITVHENDRVEAGDPLMEGVRLPNDILRVKGAEALASFLVNEIQEVYRLQGVKINDKHIETIVRQMLKRVRITDAGDSKFMLDQQVEWWKFQEENERLLRENLHPASAEPLLLGVTKASLSTDSFISAASFQETTKVLTNAAMAGKVDDLSGLKENVIMGRLISAGTGLKKYRVVPES
ncbi:MAG: DNA-directed RNA polymerase subunit beta' [Phycisphaerales bacterium JB054]